MCITVNITFLCYLTKEDIRINEEQTCSNRMMDKEWIGVVVLIFRNQLNSAITVQEKLAKLIMMLIAWEKLPFRAMTKDLTESIKRKL